MGRKRSEDDTELGAGRKQTALTVGLRAVGHQCSLTVMPLNGPPPLRDDVVAVLDSAQKLVYWVAERQDGLQIKTNNATRIPGVLLDLCLEHHVAIVHLVSGRMNGSAFALLRAQFESLVRALWLQLCATADELQDF